MPRLDGAVALSATGEVREAITLDGGTATSLSCVVGVGSVCRNAGVVLNARSWRRFSELPAHSAPRRIRRPGSCKTSVDSILPHARQGCTQE